VLLVWLVLSAGAGWRCGLMLLVGKVQLGVLMF